MGNKTSVKDMSLGGAIALLFLAGLSYFDPEGAKALPIGLEYAAGMVFTAIFAYFKDPDRPILPKIK